MNGWQKFLAALVAVVLGAGVVIDVVDNGPDHGPTKPRSTVTIHIGSSTKVDNADKDAKPNDVVELTPQAQTVAKDFAGDRADLKGPLRGPGPIGPIAKLLPPFASDSIPGCRTRFLRTNWSYRSGGAQPLLFWLHYTGGPDKPNSRADVDGLTAFGNQPSAAVSWHLNMDKDGNCDYNVPFRYKAWTEAGANSTGISIEVAGVGDAPYLRAGGVRELRRILDEVHRRYPKIRVALGGVSNCQPTKPGIVSHYMGGPCSGGHTDIKPLDLAAVIRQLQAAGRPTSTKRARWTSRHRALHARGAILDQCKRRVVKDAATCASARSRNRRYHALLGLK